MFIGGVVYDYSGHLLSSMNLFALIFCGFLYLKGSINTDNISEKTSIFFYIKYIKDDFCHLVQIVATQEI